MNLANMVVTDHFITRAAERNFNKETILNTLIEPDLIRASKQPSTVEYVRGSVSIIIDERDRALITIFRKN